MDYCGGCKTKVNEECKDSFQRKGILKVHWECWSKCNLSCPFCYRTTEFPLNTSDAKLLLRAIKTGGAKSIVFGGGDPSRRPDITELIEYANLLNLHIEVQTNAQFIPEKLLRSFNIVDLVGLSLDGPDEESHDEMRKMPGNFNQTIRLLQWLDKMKISVAVRTLVSKPNYKEIHKISDILNRFSNIVKWSLVEFSPHETGYFNREKYEIAKSTFIETVEFIKDYHQSKIPLDVYPFEKKIGTYALVTSSGRLFGVNAHAVKGKLPIVGSFLSEHLIDLVNTLPFSRENHEERYRNLVERRIKK